jgi:hypothetical protein
VIPELALKPTEGAFDLAAIHGHLDSLDTAARDPQNRDRFLLSSDPEALKSAVRERMSGKAVPYSVAVLHPGPRVIVLTTLTSDTQPSRDFVEWLRKQQPIKILDQEFNDFTDQCQGGPG